MFCLQRILPSNYDYIVCEHESLGSHGGEERFFATVRVGRQDAVPSSEADVTSDAGISSAAEAEQWLQEFETVSRTNWRVDKTYPDSRTKIIFKVMVDKLHGTVVWQNLARCT